MVGSTFPVVVYGRPVPPVVEVNVACPRTAGLQKRVVSTVVLLIPRG